MPITTFGPFVLDEDQRRIFRSGEAVAVSPKAYELLVALVHARPRVVSKGDLHSGVWPDSFVSDVTLASLIAELRRVLGDSSRTPLYIRTAHGFGYAFCAEAREARRPGRAHGPLVVTRAWVEWENGEHRCDLQEGETVIGRDPDVELQLDLPTVSRRHAAIERIGSESTLRDLGSKNGTRVGETRVESRHRLVDGDRVSIGSVVIVYRSPTSPASTLTHEERDV